jgi:hypothetical protein
MERFLPHGQRTPEQPTISADERDIIGRGLYDASVTPSRRYSFDPQRWAGSLGVATRDEELVLHNGTGLISRGADGWHARADRCYLPSVDMKLVSNYPSAQTEVTHATTGVIDVYAWMDSTSGATYAVYDSVTGAAVVTATALPGAPISKQIQLVAMGGFVSIYGYDAVSDAVWLWYVSETSPWNISAATAIASSAAAGFDICKIDEDSTLFGYVNIGTGQLHCHYMSPTGVFLTTPAPVNTALIGATGLEVTDTDTKISLAVQPQTRDVCAVWRLAGGGGRVRIVRPDLVTAVSAVQTLTGMTALQNVSCASPYLLESDGTVGFTVWAHGYAVGFTRCYGVSPSAVTTRYTRFSMLVASKAFRVGDETFCFLDTGFTDTAADGLLQHGFYLFTGNQGCHGVLCYGEGKKPKATSNWNTDIWSARGTQDQPENPVVNFTLGFNRKVEKNKGSFSSGTYADPGFRSYQLDFRSPLRTAQVGRSIYLQGVGLREYDGEMVSEAGFLMFPEGVTISLPQAGGSLTSAAVYQYRVYWGRYNSKGEFTLSAALTVQPLTTPTPGNQTYTITIPTLPATTYGQSKDIIALVYRTLGNGTTFRLESSLDPSSASCTKNSLAAATVTFVSTLSDAALAVRAVDPYSALVIDQTSPPAGSTLTLGNGRLWQTGGELGKNTAAYSKIFVTGDTPGWNEGLVYELPGETTTAALVAGQTLILGPETAWSVEGDGPTNQGLGDFPAPRFLAVDIGATQSAHAMVPGGVVVASSRGLHELTGSGSRLMGEVEREFLADPTVVAMVAQPEKQRVLVYRRSARALCWDYEHGQWSVFTNQAAVGACLWQGKLAVAVADGSVLVETPDLYADQGVMIPMVVTTGNLHPPSSQGSRMRVKMVGFTGSGQHPYHIRASLSFNEGPFRRLREWDSSQAAETDTWGAGAAWGEGGVWGQEDTQDRSSFRFRRLSPRRKCSTIAVRLETLVSAVDTDLAPRYIEFSEIQLEIGEDPDIEKLGGHRS